MRRLVTQMSRQAADDWAAGTTELARTFKVVGHALRVVALAERDAVELHHATPVQLPPELEGRVQVAALALLACAENGRDVRPAMTRRLSRALRRLVSAGEVGGHRAGDLSLGPLAEALMLAHGEVAGAMICRLAIGESS